MHVKGALKDMQKSTTHQLKEVNLRPCEQPKGWAVQKAPRKTPPEKF